MIFSSFNPLNFLFMSYLIVNMMVFNFFLLNFINSKFNLMKIIMLNFIKNDFNKINKSMVSLNLLVLLFLFNMIVNLNNLIPFTFCFNSQLNLLFFFSLIMWLCFILLNLAYMTKNFFSHMTPSGCPIILGPFMVLIELTSLIIRPITLSVRMAANMIAGHLMIHLLTEFSFFILSLNLMNLFISLLFLIILNLLEIGVAIIQSYIFCTLMNMYLNEIV